MRHLQASTSTVLRHGQYCNKHGVFYGGSQMRQETKIVLDFLWDLGLRPDNAALKNLAFVQVTAGPGDKHVKESIVCPTRSMQVDVHNLGVGQLEDASISALEDLEEDLLEAWTGCCGGTKEEDDTAPQTRSAERHTSVFVAGTREFPTSLEGTLLQAVMQQAPQTGAPGATCPDGEGHADQVKRDATMPCEVAAQHLGAPQPLAGSDAAPRRVGAGRWTPNQLPEEAGCSSVFAAVQQFTTSSEEATLKAVRKEHAAAEKDQALPLYAEERMNLRDAVFEDNIKLRTRVAKRSWKLLSALTQSWRTEPAGEGEGGGEEVAASGKSEADAEAEADADSNEAADGAAEADAEGDDGADAEDGTTDAADDITTHAA